MSQRTASRPLEGDMRADLTEPLYPPREAHGRADVMKSPAPYLKDFDRLWLSDTGVSPAVPYPGYPNLSK